MWLCAVEMESSHMRYYLYIVYTECMARMAMAVMASTAIFPSLIKSSSLLTNRGNVFCKTLCKALVKFLGNGEKC